MSGLTQVLNVAKQALLTHQSSIQVTGHNVANVDTPGYSRQSLSLKANLATPMGSMGLIGGGVMGDSITRQYDQFMIERISSQASLLGSLEAQQQSLRVLEPIFNETRGMALNDLLNQFWNSWQELSDNPEANAARQNVLQQGHQISDFLNTMNSEIIQARSNISSAFSSGINDVNSIARQIADLNTQIGTTETAGNFQANDLRDRRDNLVKELSELVDVSFFASKGGDYTVLMKDGSPLVIGDTYWQLDWSNDKLRWMSAEEEGQVTARELRSDMDLGGKLTGWLSIMNELRSGDPNNYAGRLDALANALVRELNQVHSNGSGMLRFSEQLVGAEATANTTVVEGVVDSLSASRTINSGSIRLNDIDVGAIRGGVPVYGLAMEKAANAVSAFNRVDAGVTARLTTQISGSSGVDISQSAPPLANGDQISFTVNGVEVSYTVSTPPAPAPSDADPAVFAENLAQAVNNALQAHNATAANPVNIEAVVGDGNNGAAANTLIFRNVMAGDETSITIDNLQGPVADLHNALGFPENGFIGESFVADARHNNGQITLFSETEYTLRTGANDAAFSELGLAAYSAGDGLINIQPSSSDPVLMQGFKHGNQFNNEDGSFDIWLYNRDGSLALPQPVNVSMHGVYSANDAVVAINRAISEAGGASGNPPRNWVEASFQNNRFQFTPTGDYQFAFANDSSNFLQVAGLNTFFSGHSAGTIQVNSTISNNLDYLASGRVQENGQIFPGDNTNALAISELQHRSDIDFTGGRTSSLNDFYNSLVGDIGNRGRTINRNTEFNKLVMNQMDEMRDAVSGVSLDEEMANLIKFQQAYTAAARLISKSDEMLVTLLDSVR